MNSFDNAPESKEIKGIRLFLGYIGVFFLLIGVIVLVPLIMLAIYHEETQYYHHFAVPGLGSIILGLALMLLIYKRRKARLQKWQSMLLLIIAWAVTIFVSSIPFLFDGFNFTDAIFEATSGLSTSAYSVINDVSTIPHIYLFYRCWLLFVGGIGLTLILTSAISDSNQLSLYNLEGMNDRLLPNLIKSSRLIFLIYLIYAAIGTGAYMACGQNWFNALCFSISAVSTGGYTVISGGISAVTQNAIAFEIITDVLMLLGATNFMIHFSIIRGKFKKLFYHCETICFAVMFVLFVPLYITAMTSYYQGDAGLGARHGIFLFISTITSTGFCIDPQLDLYLHLPNYLFILLLITMVVGGQQGSTSGGIKQIRLVQVAKQIYWYIGSLIKNPHMVRPHTMVKYGTRENIEVKETRGATAFVFIYIGVLLLGSFALTCFGNGFGESLFEFASVLSTAGHSCTIVLSNHGTQWIGIIGMIIGRLDPIIFITLIGKGISTLNETISHKIIERKLENN